MDTATTIEGVRDTALAKAVYRVNRVYDSPYLTVEVYAPWYHDSDAAMPDMKREKASTITFPSIAAGGGDFVLYFASQPREGQIAVVAHSYYY